MTCFLTASNNSPASPDKPIAMCKRSHFSGVRVSRISCPGFLSALTNSGWVILLVEQFFGFFDFGHQPGFTCAGIIPKECRNSIGLVNELLLKPQRQKLSLAGILLHV